MSQFYNTHRANVLSSLEKQNHTLVSAKAKGKQKAASSESDDLMPREHELPEAFGGGNGFEMAKRLLDQGIGSVGAADPRFTDLRYKVCPNNLIFSFIGGGIHGVIGRSHSRSHIFCSSVHSSCSLRSRSQVRSSLPCPLTAFAVGLASNTIKQIKRNLDVLAC